MQVFLQTNRRKHSPDMAEVIRGNPGIWNRHRLWHNNGRNIHYQTSFKHRSIIKISYQLRSSFSIANQIEFDLRFIDLRL